MTNDRECFIDLASRSMSERQIVTQVTVLRDGPLPTTPNSNPSTEIQGGFTIKSRAYQLEMLEESLKRNTIVAMDTGTGKTHVAVLRIKKELEVTPASKLIWFLTPTVELCSQQLLVLQSQISSIQIKSFTSADNVDRWTDKANWDAVLTNVKVVVSTYAVLCDALCHGFVDMESLALIIFDEAHHCIGRSPGSKIMRDFYWPKKHREHPVPHILGLTASPVMGSRLNDLETLESTLDSTCKSPCLQKHEFLLHANRPNLKVVPFEQNQVTTDFPRHTQAMEILGAVRENLNIYEDPQILRMKARNTEASRNQMERALRKHKTFIQDQVNSFIRRSAEIYRALGAWAADFYVSWVTSSFIKAADAKDVRFLEWGDSEKQYLAKALRHVDEASPILSVLSEKSISLKVRALINFLHSCEKRALGIIFVKERAVAYMLHRLLSNHSETCHHLRFGIIVGSSQQPRGKRDMCEISNSGNGLEKFRSGEINFLIGTSVLEEGIDIPQCKLVICFDEPATLKSYIQCRGRARMPGSELVVLLDTTSQAQTKEWAKLECEMKRRYEEEDRSVRRLEEIEATETEKSMSRQFRVQSTGALLDMDNAKGHLECFCSRLSSHSSVDMHPEYIIVEEGEEEGGHSDQPLLSAKVILPATLDSSLRVFKSRLSWRSEKKATKDAAFEAYVALYHAGLINDHLLPLGFSDSPKYMEKQDSIVEVCERLNPWPRIARAWERRERLQRRSLTLKDQCGSIKCVVDMLIPAKLTGMGPITIYWDAYTMWRIELGSPTNVPQSNLTADHSKILLSLAYGHRWKVDSTRQVVLFNVRDISISQSKLESVQFTPKDCSDDSVGLLRDAESDGIPYIFHSWPLTKPSIRSIEAPHKDYENFPGDQAFVALKKWPYRSDFLHPVNFNHGPNRQKYFSVLPQRQVEIDIVPTSYSQFGLLIPSILHKVEVQLVVEELCATVLDSTEVVNLELIRTAISTSVAREQDNYQKLEFLGDSILKLLVSVFLASTKPHFPEGYLSSNKDAIVSNSRLCRAALERGLDKFILAEVFTGSKWRPLYVDNLLEDQEEGTRRMPSKTIADVVESLIGAGWKMGGLQTSLSIAKSFLPELDLPSLETGRGRLFDLAPAQMQLPANLYPLETLARYSFKKKSLLIQAMSHRSDSTAIASYERLEFLGDAILEIIIGTELFTFEDNLSQSLMHLCKTALVNGDYLGFIALEWNITQRKTDFRENPNTGNIETVESHFDLPLWRFMRHGSSGIGKAQHDLERRHELLRHEVLFAIDSSTTYPWTLLAKLHINKFYSDLVESLLAAVWIDSGSMDVCKQLLGRMGILRYLHRIVQDRVHVLHPREELNILADGEKVEYEVQIQNVNEESAEWTCTVFVGETKICEVAHGVSGDEVKTRAAERAVYLLRSANGSSVLS